jgi:hypothetical protein
VNGNGGSGGLLDGLMGMMMWNQNTKNGENEAASPVINVKKSDVAVVEPVAKSPVGKVNSVKQPEPPKSPIHSPVAKSEPVAKTDIASVFDELPPEYPNHSPVGKFEDVAEIDIDSVFGELQFDDI